MHNRLHIGQAAEIAVENLRLRLGTSVEHAMKRDGPEGATNTPPGLTKHDLATGGQNGC